MIDAATNRLGASSIMTIRYSFSPRPSSQSCSLVSHCTSSPYRLRRGRQTCTCSTFPDFTRHTFPRIIHCRTVSLLASIPCFFRRYSAASVGPKPRYTSAERIFTASHSMASSILRFDGLPRRPWITALSPRFFNAQSSRFTCRMLNPSSSAAARCVISFFLAFFNVTKRSLSACVISRCPSCIPPALGCQEDISTFLKGDIITLPRHRQQSPLPILQKCNIIKTATWIVELLDARVRDELEALPPDMKARFSRIVELIQEYGLEQQAQHHAK